MTQQPWISEALLHVGLKEIKGPTHNQIISGWLKRLQAWWDDDETPWCGVFVAHCLQETGFPVPSLWMRAKEWLNWGMAIEMPVLGCVVVFDRAGGGHVGFVMGYDHQGNLMVLGGNQGDAVSIRPFDKSRVLGYRWPVNTPIILKPLPIIDSDGNLSENEA